MAILNSNETRRVVSPDQPKSRSKPKLEYHDQIEQRHVGHDKENWWLDVELFVWGPQ